MNTQTNLICVRSAQSIPSTCSDSVHEFQSQRHPNLLFFLCNFAHIHCIQMLRWDTKLYQNQSIFGYQTITQNEIIIGIEIGLIVSHG